MTITVDPNKRAGLSRAARHGYAPQIAPEIIEQIMGADARASHRTMANTIYLYAMAKPEGAPMPRREALADLLGVSVYIVRAGLKVLASVGLYVWERVPGEGGRWHTEAVHLARPAEGVAEAVEALRPPAEPVDNPPKGVHNPVSTGHTEGRSPNGEGPAIIPSSSKKGIERAPKAPPALSRAARAAQQSASLLLLLGLSPSRA